MFRDPDSSRFGPLACALLAAALLPACASSTPPPPPAPAPPPVIVQAPTPEITFKTIFVDNFDAVQGEWQQVSGYWETVGGHMIQKTDDPRQLNAIRFVLSPRIADATIETLVRVNPTRPVALTNSAQDQDLMRNIRYLIGAGIVFRMKDPQNYYMWRLAGEEGAVLGRMQNGAWTEPDLCNPRVRDSLQGDRIGFRADNWYRLKVEAYGNRFVVFINDEPVCSVTDDTFTVGQFGLVTFKTAADFDYIKVWDKREPQIKPR